MSNDENFITDYDRHVADALAEKFDHEPDYEHSAAVRRNVESAFLYVEVHGLSFANGTALVTLDDHERYATERDMLTPVIAAAIAEARRLAWADCDGPTMMDALMASFNAIHAERMKPERLERERREVDLLFEEDDDEEDE